MELSNEKSIEKFYDDAEVFITGGSGFIGKVLIEKLLRSCRGIKAIYLLIRPRKGMSFEQRVDKLTDNLVSALRLQSGFCLTVGSSFSCTNP